MDKNKKSLNASAKSKQRLPIKRMERLTNWGRKSKSLEERHLIFKLISFYWDRLDH